MKRILVTGASGFLGANLVSRLLNKGNIEVIAILGRPEDKAHFLPQGKNIIVYPSSQLFTTDFGHVDTLIHTAFSRGDNMQGLVSSIDLTEKVIELVNDQNIDSFLNISTQGLYQGLKPGEKAAEDGLICPNTAYGLAKWAVENMLKIGCHKFHTSIRMASLSSNARFLDFFVDRVIANVEIRVTAPRQFASIMDVSDAVEGILSIEEIPLSQRDIVYNLGPEVQYSILDYAKMADVVGKSFGFASQGIIVDDSGKEFSICMDCSRLREQTKWACRIDDEIMIQKLFQDKLHAQHQTD